MKKVLCKTQIVFLVAILATGVTATSFNLTAEGIKDSAALLEKIKQPNDPLFPYFSKGKTPTTRADLIAVINEKILSNTRFAFETTQLNELKTSDRFENLSSEKQEEILARNRDLLTELYPDEIAPRDKNAVKQTVGLKLLVKHAEDAVWLKAEIMQFLNEIVGNEKIMSNWRNLTTFFDSSVADSDLEAFTEELKMKSCKIIFPLWALYSTLLYQPSFAKITQESCNDFLHISIKNNPINFSSELKTVTENNLVKAVNKANGVINRRDDAIDPDLAKNIVSRLHGIGLYRLGGSDTINCVIGVDNALSRLVVIDSKNQRSDDFKLCGPVIKRRSGFPWFRISWECATLWAYSFSNLKGFGEFGKAEMQFITRKT